MADKQEQETRDVDHILVLKEPGEEEYSVSDSDLEFDLMIQEDGSLAVRQGIITTPYFIQNSQLEFLKSWRYELHNIVFQSIHVNAGKNTLTYLFTLEDPEDFLEYTSIAEAEEDGSDAA